MILLVCFLFLLQCFTEAFPGYGLKSVPRRAVMFGGYYSNPLRIPPGSMTAILSGDTIATNSFAGDPFYHQFSQNPFKEEDEELTNQKRLNVQTEEEEKDEEQLEVSTTVKPKRIPKRKPQKPKLEDDEEEDDKSSGWPFKTDTVPSYNAFFPIMIGGGGSGGSRTRSGDEGYAPYPGSATAIANSFSTGKGGVASSHAISFGDPYTAQLYKNGFFTKSSRNQ